MPDCPENEKVTLLLVACVLVGSSAIQSATGSGFGLVAGPALILIAPQLVPVPLLILTIPTMLLVTLTERAHCNLQAVLIATVTMIPGIVVGLWFLTSVDANVTHPLVAIAALVAGFALLTGSSFAGSRLAFSVAGLAAGFMGALAAMPGPPLSMTYRPTDAAELRSTLSAIFLVMAVVTLVAMEIQVGIVRSDLLAATALAPLVPCGHVLGTYVAGRTSPFFLSRVTIYIIIAAAATLLIRCAVSAV